MDIAIFGAYWRLMTLNDREPLAKLIEQRNTAVLEDPKIAKLIARLVRGKSRYEKKGAPPKSDDKHKWMAARMHYYLSLGIPFKSEFNKQGLLDCLDIVAGEFDCVRKTVETAWKAHGHKPGTMADMLKYIAQEELKQYPEETARRIEALRRGEKKSTFFLPLCDKNKRGKK